MNIFNQKKILILGAGGLQIPAIIESKKMGLITVVVDYDKNAVGIKYADIFYNVSTLDVDAVLEVARKECVDGIITICSDRPVNIVAKVGCLLGLKSISESTAFKATNKCAMRDALKEKNVPIPKYIKVSTYKEYINAIAEFGYPCICKPSDNSGSRGVSLINSDEDDLKSIFNYAIENSLDGQVLLEEYMIGPEVSVEIMVENSKIEIIQITDKITTGGPHFVEMGHTQPSRLSESLKSIIKSVSVEAVNAIGINNGPAHVEIIVTEDGPKIVELGARLGGDYITTDLVPLSTGYNMVKANIEIAMGMKNTEKVLFNNTSAIRYFNNTKSIMLDKKSMNLLDKFFISFDNHEIIQSSLDRQGYYIVSAGNFKKMDEKINKIEECI